MATEGDAAARCPTGMWTFIVRRRPGFKRHFVRLLTLFDYFSFIYLFIIYLFLAALGLRCCARAFSSCGERGLLFIAVHRLLIAVASLVVAHGL